MTDARGSISTLNSKAITAPAYAKAAKATLQAASTTTATLATTASFVNNLYMGNVLYIASGTGSGQSRKISAYVGTTRVATLESSWDITPDSSSTYIVLPNSNSLHSQDVDTENSIRLCPIWGDRRDDRYKGAFIKNLRTGEIAMGTSYTGSTQMLTVDRVWDDRPVKGDLYAIYGEGGAVVEAAAINTSSIKIPSSSIVASGHTVEIISGSGVGQCRTLFGTPTHVEQVTTLQMTSGTRADYANKYVLIPVSDGRIMAFWFNVESGGTQPTLTCAVETFEVALTTSETGSDSIASKFSSSITSNLNLLAWSTGDTIYVPFGSGESPNEPYTDSSDITIVADGTGDSTLGHSVWSVYPKWTTALSTSSRYVVYSGWCGAFEDVSGQSQVATSVHIDIPSAECALVDMNFSPVSTGLSVRRRYAVLCSVTDKATHTESVSAQFFRARVVGLGTSLTGVAQSMLHVSRNRGVTTALHEAISGGADCEVVRAVLTGRTDGARYRNVGTDARGAVLTRITHPLTAFGEVITAESVPITQTSFVYGIVNQLTDVVLSPGMAVRQTVKGDSSTKQKYRVWCAPKAGYNNTGYADYFELTSTNPTPATYHFWFSTGSAPMANGNAVEVDIDTDTTAATVASSLVRAVNGISGTPFAATVSGSVVDIENSYVGDPTAQLAVVPASFPIREALPDSTDTALSRLGNGGSDVTVSDAVMSAKTDAGVSGAYATVKTRRAMVYRAGQGTEARFTAVFSAPASGVTQLAGFMNPTNALCFGTNGSTGKFGILRRYGGRLEVYTLTVASSVSGSGDVYVVLDGVRTRVTLASSDSTTTVAHKIASTSFVHCGFTATANDSTVIFSSERSTSYEGARSVGTYGVAYSSSGAVTWHGDAPSMTSTATGAAATDEWVAKDDWNMDKMDGAGTSGLRLDVTQGNVYRITYQWLGFGAIRFEVENPITGDFHPVHIIRYAGTGTTPSITLPSMRLTWHSESDTTAVTGGTLKGVSAGLFTQGISRCLTPRFSYRSSVKHAPGNGVAAAVLAIRVCRTLNGLCALSEAVIQSMTVDNTKANPSSVHIYLNRTFTSSATPAWVWVEEGQSSLQRWEAPTTDGVTDFNTDGTLLLTVGGTNDSSTLYDLSPFEIELSEGDSLMFIAQRVTAVNEAEAQISVSWAEHH